MGRVRHRELKLAQDRKVKKAQGVVYDTGIGENTGDKGRDVILQEISPK